MMRNFATLVLAVCLAACANMAGINSAEAQRNVFAAKEAYKIALEQAVKYESRPRCVTAAMALSCSSTAVVEQLRKADKVASGALDAAESAVRTPQISGNATSQAIATANSALAAFSALLSMTGAIQ